MQTIAQALIKLFKSAQRISTRTGKGLLTHGAGKYGVNAVRQLNLTVRGVKISYQELSTFDKAAIDEAVEYATRVAFEYIDHHDEHTQYRIQGASLDDVVLSHAREIKEAAEAALYSRMRSHGYDALAGKAPRVATFQDEDLLKQAVFAIIQEVVAHIDEQAA